MLAAVLIGAGPLVEPLMVGSMAANQTAMLKYSREMEQEADSLGFKWMLKAGYDPRDILSIFKKLNRQRWFEGGKIPLYLSTHPDNDSRIVDLGHQIEAQPRTLVRQADNPDFHFFSLKLEAIYGNPHQLLRRTTRDIQREPNSAAAFYGQALALARLERSSEATAAFQQALRLAPGNILIQRDLAAFNFYLGRHQEAQQVLESLSRQNPRDEVALFYLGRICQERHQVDQALALMEKVHNLNPALIDVYLNLGTLYGEKGNMGLAHYYLGFHSLKAKAYPTALFHFKKALTNLPAGDSRCAEVKSQIARLEKLKVRVSN
jgi:predicted Zn-dependent protease